jgi:predicted DNA-binding protein
MANETTSEKRIRLTLDLTPRQFSKLKGLEEETGATKAEIVRNALRLYTYVAERALAGDSFRAVDKHGRAAEVVLVELT